MKKIFILGLLTTTFISCSTDNQLENSNSKNETKTVLGLKSDENNSIFEEYINSQEYIVYDEAVSDFTSLLNYKGSLSDINSMEKLESYVNNNLHLTNFSSYTQFSSKKTNLLNLIATLKGTPSYVKFKDLVLATDLTILEGYFGTWFGSNRTANADCEKDYKSCNDDVTSQYAKSMKETLQAQKDGSISSRDAHNNYVMAEVALKIGRDNCDSAFKDCITK
ncbi:hypothetical protein MG290_11540 [Flavobacterium sp. CBA20B-1]|uniref:hypothetical protein n=1 Tax=unclassified Flavobacterium TaxID=196869 RepID=UPI002225B1B5|nr:MULTISPECIES: hypothetical protein [unclassified Flavobacterium]WCM41575.1 hypothetical protein MG290_11540 [Flavobacterium sp. CBA20B-1]